MTASTISNPTQTKPDAIRVVSAAIDARALGFRYGDREALYDVTFAIARAEIFGFLGPNGGGKTTLFKLLSTLAPIQTGSARLFGHDLAGDTGAVRRWLGVVFQHPSLDGKLTVGENLAAHGHLYGISGARLRERSGAMLERLGLTPRARDRVETLSGGLQRRVELAKALLHLREHDGVTVVLTTHYMEEAERCDRIGIMHQGKLVAIAPPNELKSEVGGDVIVIHTAAPELLQRKILTRFKLKSQLVDGAIRIEKLRGHELVRDLIDAFGEEIESVSFGKPTLEDVFVHLTGHQFFAHTSQAE